MVLLEWSAVAQWFDHAADDREGASLNPTCAAWKLWQFPVPYFANCISEETLKAVNLFNPEPRYFGVGDGCLR